MCLTLSEAANRSFSNFCLISKQFPHNIGGIFSFRHNFETNSTEQDNGFKVFLRITQNQNKHV